MSDHGVSSLVLRIKKINNSYIFVLIFFCDVIPSDTLGILISDSIISIARHRIIRDNQDQLGDAVLLNPF